MIGKINKTMEDIEVVVSKMEIPTQYGVIKKNKTEAVWENYYKKQNNLS